MGGRLITITGRQRFEDGSEDVMELTTVGNYYQRKNSFYIIYKESEISGMAGVTTSIQVKDEMVVLNRMGPVELKQQFECGVLHQAAYVTPYGTIMMGVFTKEKSVDLTSQGGNINLNYDLYIEKGLLSQNELRINIKEDNPHESI